MSKCYTCGVFWLYPKYKTFSYRYFSHLANSSHFREILFFCVLKQTIWTYFRRLCIVVSDIRTFTALAAGHFYCKGFLSCNLYFTMRQICQQKITEAKLNQWKVALCTWHKGFKYNNVGSRNSHCLSMFCLITTGRLGVSIETVDWLWFFWYWI